MIVGPVLPRPRADKQRVAGLTAPPVPTASRGSSGPLYPKPFHARFLDHFACKGRSVSLNRFRTRWPVVLDIAGF
jgi:hypothetical protein